MVKPLKQGRLEAKQKRIQNHERNQKRRRVRNQYLIEQIWDTRFDLSDIERVILVQIPKKGIPMRARENFLPNILKEYLNNKSVQDTSEKFNISPGYIRSYYSRIEHVIITKYGSVEYLEKLLSDKKDMNR